MWGLHFILNYMYLSLIYFFTYSIAYDAIYYYKRYHVLF